MKRRLPSTHTERQKIALAKLSSRSAVQDNSEGVLLHGIHTPCTYHGVWIQRGKKET